MSGTVRIGTDTASSRLTVGEGLQNFFRKKTHWVETVLLFRYKPLADIWSPDVTVDKGPVKAL